MAKIYVVKYTEYGESGIVCAFTEESEAELLAEAMEEEKDSKDLYFYVSTIDLYNLVEDMEYDAN